MPAGVMKIKKIDWQKLGGLRNPELFRKADKRGVWSYYRDLRR